MFIECKITLQGNEVVNYGAKDGVPQEFLLNANNKNVKYAKVNVTIDAAGKLTRRELFISPQCLKQKLIGAPAGACLNILPAAQREKLYATPTFLLKGWMNTSPDAYKRKSPISIGQAVEVSGAVPTFHVGSSVGNRDSNSFFFVENVGNTEYVAKVFLDLDELSFLPLDPTLDRHSLPDHIYNSPNFVKKYAEAFGVPLGERGLYVRKGDPTETEEVGIVIGKKEINHMAKMFYTSLLNLSIKKATGFAGVTEVKAVVKANHADDGVEWDGMSDIDLPEVYVKHADWSAWNARKAAYDQEQKEKAEKEAAKRDETKAKGGKKGSVKLTGAA